LIGHPTFGGDVNIIIYYIMSREKIFENNKKSPRRNRGLHHYTWCIERRKTFVKQKFKQKTTMTI